MIPPVPVSDIVDNRVRLPSIVTEKLPFAHTRDETNVAALQSTLAASLGILLVTVLEAVKAQSMTAISCGSGMRDVQFAATPQLPPEVFIQCWVVDAVNVIPVFPPQSPEFPAIADRFHEPAPAAVMLAISR